MCIFGTSHPWALAGRVVGSLPGLSPLPNWLIRAATVGCCSEGLVGDGDDDMAREVDIELLLASFLLISSDLELPSTFLASCMHQLS